MPIRLNLLAEAQAAEEARRRDPVKRAAWVAALIVVAILVWSSTLQLKAMLLRSDVGRLEGQINVHSNEYRVVADNLNKTADLKHKLDGLRQLSSQRLLLGTFLNGLQQSTADDVQLVRLRLDQSYSYFEGTKPRTNDDQVRIPGRPATSTERVLLTLEGADTADKPGDGLNKYKDGLATNAYFRQVLLKSNAISLKSLAPPGPSRINGKRSSMFTLECRFPEITR